MRARGKAVPACGLEQRAGSARSDHRGLAARAGVKTGWRGMMQAGCSSMRDGSARRCARRAMTMRGRRRLHSCSRPRSRRFDLRERDDDLDVWREEESSAPRQRARCPPGCQGRGGMDARPNPHCAPHHALSQAQTGNLSAAGSLPARLALAFGSGYCSTPHGLEMQPFSARGRPASPKASFIAHCPTHHRCRGWSCCNRVPAPQHAVPTSITAPGAQMLKRH